MWSVCLTVCVCLCVCVCVCVCVTDAYQNDDSLEDAFRRHNS